MGPLRNKTVRNSQLWAAYGDALGFMTELADAALVKRRTGVSEVTQLLPWKRMIGGKYGALAQLPAGCYSDDTQLRLSTARCIRSNGFDIEAFAKVELPVWRSYALGGGRGTKSASASLVKSSVHWYCNFYNTPSVSYFESGGNGAAMRIQPHVWAAKGEPPLWLPDVVQNVVTSHGHTRGLVGAVFHALAVWHATHDRRVLDARSSQRLIQECRSIINIIANDDQLSTLWLPSWEASSGKQFESAYLESVDELEDLIRLAQREMRESKAIDSYKALVDGFDGRSAARKGCAIRTAVLASCAVELFERPLEGMRTIVNVLGSDTDTIATMAGAIWGCIVQEAPPEEVLDAPLLIQEADRLQMISMNRTVAAHAYPDLLFFRPMANEVDCLGLIDERPVLSGLGFVERMREPSIARGDTVWDWWRTRFGQTVLVKHRRLLRSFESSHLPIETRQQKNESLFTPPTQVVTVSRPRTLDDWTNFVIKGGFDHALIGEGLLYFAEQSDGLEKAIAFASIIAKARVARTRQDKRR